MGSAPQPIDPQTEISVVNAYRRARLDYRRFKTLLAEYGIDSFERILTTGKRGQAIKISELRRITRDHTPPKSWKTINALREQLGRSTPILQRWMEEEGITGRSYPKGVYYSPADQKKLRDRARAHKPAGTWLTANAIILDLVRKVPLLRIKGIIALPAFQLLVEERETTGGHLCPHFPPRTKKVILWYISAEDEPIIRAEERLSLKELADRTQIPVRWVREATSNNFDTAASLFMASPTGHVVRYLPPSYEQILQRRYLKYLRAQVPLSATMVSETTIIKRLTIYCGQDRLRAIFDRPEIQALGSLRRLKMGGRPLYVYSAQTAHTILAIVAAEDQAELTAPRKFMPLDLVASRLACDPDWLFSNVTGENTALKRRITLQANGTPRLWLQRSDLPLIRRRWRRYMRVAAGYAANASQITSPELLPLQGDWPNRAYFLSMYRQLPRARISRALSRPELREISEFRRFNEGGVGLCYNPSGIRRFELLIAGTYTDAVAKGGYLTAQAVARALHSVPDWTVYALRRYVTPQYVAAIITPDGEFRLIYSERVLPLIRRKWIVYRRSLDTAPRRRR